MKRLHAVLLASALALTVLPAIGTAAWPHERQGVVLGFGLGTGNANLTSSTRGDGSAFSTALDAFVTGREYVGAVDMRVGWAFNDRLALGFELAGWSRKFNVEYATYERRAITWTCTIPAIALTWYPGGAGLLLRGGIGWGRAAARIETTPEASSVVSKETASDGGPAVLMGLGYEWRLTRRFALGPAINFGAMNLGNGRKANFGNVTVGATWYL